MSDFKIIGNPNPVVGVLEFYTVSDFFSQISPSQEFVYTPKSPENQVKWEVYVLEFGKWRKTKENDKTGKQVTYTFFEKSLTRKGIRLLARKGDKVARLDIKPLPAHPKIDHVELLDKNGSKITGRLAYGQTVKARVFCLNMEKHRVHVTLWEDDVKGAGHSKANEKNFIETRSAIVNFGKADIDFLLRPSFAKIATKGGPENDKIHEYYVTAEYDREKTASSNVNVNAPETPVAPYKGKTTQKATAVTKTPAKQPKTELPKSDKPNAPAKAKGKINSVNITDTSGHAIKGRFREKQIKVWINSSNLIGKEVRLKLFDDDYRKDDLLFQKEFTIQSDLHAIVVSLNTIPRSWGGNFLAEGNEQELFAEVEVIQTHAFTKSAIVDVDASVFKQDPFEIFNTLFKVDMPDKKEKKEENCGEKYCIKKGDKSELIREINIRLSGFGGNVPTDEFTYRTEKMIKQFQRDYMQVPETGKVCGNVLKAIDKFSLNFDLSGAIWSDLDCSCTTKGSNVTSSLRVISEINNCKGWGDGTGKGTYKIGNAEKDHKYEYPGIHRSLLFGFKAVLFYLSKHPTYRFRKMSSGYRCRFKNYMTTNHQGKAIDIQFKDTGDIGGALQSNIPKLKKIREDIFYKYLNAKTSWVHGTNNFCLEPIALIYKPNGKVDQNYTYSWIHFDVREFESIYLEDKYFCKNKNGLNGISIIQIAKKYGFEKTCNCFSNEKTKNNQSSKAYSTGSCIDKFNKLAPIILEHEGGYKNEPSKDKGDPTNKGISWPVWVKYAKTDLNIEPTVENQRNLTSEQATIIYRKRYWEPKGYCEIEDLKIALMVYDWSITSGGAIKEIQKLLVNEYSQTIAIDGGMGKNTATAINDASKQGDLLNKIADIRRAYYKKGADEGWFSYDYSKGLDNRVTKCLNYEL